MGFRQHDGLSRRRLLGVAGGTSVAALIAAACGGSSDSETS
jgi:hypothetical protein